MWPARPSIGRPIANGEIYLLDAHLNPVPVGAPGELHIGGDGLSRGYLNRADLTAEKFIPNPFRNEPGARLYRTGDLARHLADGNIEFLGRIDHQVKIRGYRIELGEIEVILGQHPLIKQTVVVARENAPGNKRLVAYLVATGGETLSAMDLRNMLKQKLPEFMIPSSFVFVDSLTLGERRERGGGGGGRGGEEGREGGGREGRGGGGGGGKGRRVVEEEIRGQGRH